MENNTKSKALLPLAIIIAGILVAGAVIYSKNSGNKNAPATTDNQPSTAATLKPADINLDPVSTSTDHILGNPDAKLTIVEYSDLECPFCKTFQETMKSMMEKYGKDGSINWVYRHFPIKELHSKAPNEAAASECAYDQGGNDKFWQFIDKVYEITPSNNGLDPAKLPEIAKQIGLNVSKFNSCLSSGKFTKKVEDMYQSGVKAGVESTPNSVLVSKDPINKATTDFMAGLNSEFRKQTGQDVFLISKDGTRVIVFGALPSQIMDQILSKILSK